MQSKEYWEKVYTTKAPDNVSWFQPHAETSMRLIHNAGLGRDAAIIDVGGGAKPIVFWPWPQCGRLPFRLIFWLLANVFFTKGLPVDTKRICVGFLLVMSPFIASAF